jgi:hypothetical protein
LIPYKGEYGSCSLVKHKEQGENYALFYFAGRRFYIYIFMM